MNIFVINLKRRLDRKEHTSSVLKDLPHTFIEAIDHKEHDFEFEGITAYRKWVDPLSKRMILPGEIATTLSHIEAWKMIAESGQAGIVLEDDNIITDKINLDKINSILAHCDMLYLGYREMSKKPLSTLTIEGVDLNVPIYPYLASSYAITSEFAKYLISLKLEENVIPVDEFFPIINGIKNDDYLDHDYNTKKIFTELTSLFYKKESKIFALKNSMFKQLSRAEMGSDIEGLIPFNIMHFVTYGTDESKMYMLRHSAHSNETACVNMGKEKIWDGGDVSIGPGGGQKINGLIDFLLKIPDNDLVVFCDAYDVFITANIGTIADRFAKQQCDILFAGEKTCWPDPTLKDMFPLTDTDYRFLNSGCIIGYRWALVRMIKDYVKNKDDDQLFYQKKYLEYLDSKKIKIKIDHGCTLFQCLDDSVNDIALYNSIIYNKVTDSTPVVIHGNGSQDTKKHLLNLYNQYFMIPSTDRISQVSSEILTCNFFTRAQCEKIISEAELYNNWQSMPGDIFPGKEIRVKSFNPSLYYTIKDYFLSRLRPALEKYWFPLHIYDVRDMFIIKYEEGLQTALPCHHDASLVSASIKLNDNYEGADLYFYRQDFSNTEIPVGDMILWPSGVTHGHECRPLTKGVKYSLTIWTSRFEGDIN